MKKHTKEKLWKGTRGAISILLVCLLLPFISIATLYLEAGRYQSGIRALDQSLSSSAVSTLANMDSYLLNRFGLMSVSQKTEEVDEEFTTTLTSYFNKQETTDRNAVDVSSLSVNGVYPLADLSVLKQQVLETASVMAPFKFVVEIGDVDSLVKQIQKSLKFLTIIESFTEGVKLFEKEIAATEAISDAKDQMKEVQKKKEAYDKAFTEWQDAVESLAEHLATERPDPEKNKSQAENWDKTKNNRTETAENKRLDYISSIDDLIAELDELQSSLNDAIASQEDANKQADTLIFSMIKTGIDQKLADEEDKDVKAFGDTMKNVASGSESAMKTYYSKLSDLTDTFSLEALENAVQGLLIEKQNVSDYQTSSITGSTGRPESSLYHFVVLDNLTDPDAIDEFLEEAEKELNDTGILDVLEALVEIYTELYTTDTLADAELNVRLNLDYYGDTMGGLPSLTDSSYSNPFAEQDQAASMAYLEEIDPDYDADDPYGLTANSIEGKFQKLMDEIDELLDCASDVKDADGFIEKCKAIIACLKQGLKVIGSLIDLFATLVTDLVEAVYNKFLLSTYLAYNMPNRTNYDTGTGLAGYKYGNIARHASAPLSNVPVVGDIAAFLSDGQEGYCFRGAELEYIIWGSEYELINQMKHFFALMLLRLVLNIPKVFTDEMWGSIIEPLIPVYGIGIILGVCVSTVESFVDATILANGGEIQLIKEHVFLSPAGLPDMIEQFTYVKLSDAAKKKIIQSAAEATDTKYEDYTKPSTQSPDKTEKPLIDWDKYGEGLLTFDYSEYSLMLMFFFSSEKKSLARLADLIQCEKTLRNLTTDASLSQQVSDEYDQFNINKAYTMLRVEAAGTMRPMLPVSAMATFSALEVNRVLYRGY